MKALGGLMAVVLTASVIPNARGAARATLGGSIGDTTLAAPSSAATPRAARLQSLSLIPTSGQAELVMRVSGGVTTHDFALKSPDKIVVDIYGATLGIPAGASYDGTPRGPITDVRYGQFNKTTVRVVLTLSERRAYKLLKSAGELRIAVEGKSKTFERWGTTAAPSLARVTPPSDAVVVPKRAPSVARERAHASVTPVVNRQQVTVQPSRQRPITISWLNTDIREVLAAFQEFSGRTIIPSKDVTGTITANIVNQPWDVAMKALLHAYGYDAVEDPISGIITVDTEAHLQGQKAIEPLASAPPVQLNYARAAAIAPIVATRLTRDCGPSAAPIAAAPVGGAAAAAGAPAATAPAGAPSAQPPMPGITPPPGVSATANAPAQAASAAPVTIAAGANCPARGAVIADTVLNTLNIVDIQSNLQELIDYARSLDIRPQQVNIRAKVVTIKRDQLDELGLQYSIGAHQQGFMNATTGARVDSSGNTVLAGPLVALGGNAVAAIANASEAVPLATLQLVFSTAMGNYDLSAFLAAAHTLTLTDDQAEPSASVLNNRTAQLVSGTQVPIRTINLAGAATGAPPAANVGFQQTGVILQVTPQITNNRQVEMKIHVEESLLGAVTDVGAQVDKQSVDNEVLVADGETAVMGGLTQTTLSVVKDGIPFLVDLPLIGPLFGRTQHHEIKNDVLILITPHIIDEGQIAPPTGGSPL